MAVAIWNKCPSAQELLDMRLQNGWKPTMSDLRDGAKVLGYAACLIDESP